METISKKFINPIEDKISQINHDIKYWIKTNIPFKKIAIILGILIYFLIRSRNTYKNFGKFKIVVSNHNSNGFIIKCLKSIKKQKYKYYDVVVIDDHSDDLREWEFIRKYCKKQKWKSLRTSRSVGSLYCYNLAINMHKCKDNDIILMINGHDWLFTKDSLKIYKSVYKKSKELCFTFGNHINYIPGLRKYQPNNKSHTIKSEWEIINDIIHNDSYRQNRWIYFFPITFKYYLWKNLNKEYLLGPDKRFYKNNRVIVYPLLEIAQGRIQYISDITYATSDYTNENTNIDYILDKEYPLTVPHESPFTNKTYILNGKTRFGDRNKINILKYVKNII